MSVRALDLIATARGYIDTPFVHQGRVPGRALDCVGLLVCALRAHGVPVADESGYKRDPDPPTLRAGLERNGLLRVSRAALRPGDVIWYVMDAPRHVALYTERDSVIHALARVGRVTEHGLAGEWLARIRAVYRHPEVSVE